MFQRRAIVFLFVVSIQYAQCTQSSSIVPIHEKKFNVHETVGRFTVDVFLNQRTKEFSITVAAID